MEPDIQDERAEAELLLLLRSLRHPNIVELLAAYTQNGITNLIFYPADMDLHDFLLQSERPAGFREAFHFQEAMHGLSDGLSYLHNFRPRQNPLQTDCEAFMHGSHHDIKPRNILVRGTEFFLADFGTSKMKENYKPSQTSWKHTTFEYGAPECRDPESLAACRVGRPLDIWSLACIFTEIVTYMEHGQQGVLKFRQKRLRDGLYGDLQCFHDDECLNPIVRIHIDDLEERTSESSTRKVLCTVLTMFATKPADRIRADKVEKDLACATLEALLDALLGKIDDFRHSTDVIADRNLYTTRLNIEVNRLLAWASALGIKHTLNPLRAFDERILSSFSHSCKVLQAGLDFFNGELDHDAIDDTSAMVLSLLSQTNRDLCRFLSPESRASVDQIFLIITAKARENYRLQDISTLGEMLSGQIDDESTSTAIRYMTLLLEKHGKDRVNSHHIDPTLLREEDAKHGIFIRPRIHFRRYGYGPGEERKTLVEIMPYWLKKHSSSSEDFRPAIETMFSRVQDLVDILQIKPRPVDLRILECLGTSHAPRKAGFGLVYGFPSEDTEPIRLNKLLQHRKRSEIYPELGEKIILAKTIVACVQSLHTFGWVHKSISSLNVLLFYNPTRGLIDIDFGKPFITGLDYSRRDGKGEYSQGHLHTANPGSNSDFINTCKEYLHPDYRLGSLTNAGKTQFSLSFDYYALGLLLLEIGTWTSLSNIYESSRRVNHSPRDLWQEYIRYCDEHLGKAMGSIFQSVTKRCLEYDEVNIDQASAQLWFQTQVIDQLNRCVF